MESGLQYLRCDNPECGETHVVGQITADHIGIPCTKCGSNLLTQQDWEQWVNLESIFGIAVILAEDTPDGDLITDAISPKNSSSADANMNDSQSAVGMHVHNGVVTVTVDDSYPARARAQIESGQSVENTELDSALLD